eukprot:11348513-Alexandrium_andersonii.AAC.1
MADRTAPCKADWRGSPFGFGRLQAPGSPWSLPSGQDRGLFRAIGALLNRPWQGPALAALGSR